MDTNSLGLIELILVFGGVLGFAFWELYSLRKYKKQKQREKDDDPNA